MAHDSEALNLRRITKEEAARAFMACAGLDPEGTETPESAAQAGDCWAVSDSRGEVALSIDFCGGVAWIVAGAGGGGGMASDTLACVEWLAVRMGCKAVGFQTVRAGLVRVACRSGYRITERVGAGVKLEKEL